ncbi:ABC transporter family protein [Zymoseptoria brevis]|uniref:ABC transporter family protein n=1 Tax=Zymoseptoria brevis TaxID=1047168 RepID=A0A0F4GEQ6_9PEZI|nr:ABC transporter family protein [Zymoseptoria brevis]
MGYRRPLELDDIWLVNPDRGIDVMVERFDAHMERNTARGVNMPLLWALHTSFAKEFWIGGMCLLIASICQVTSPLTLRYLIQFAQDAYAAKVAQENASIPSGAPPGPSAGRGLGLVFAIMGLQLIQSVGTNQFMYHGFLVGGQARAVLIMAIFEKSLRLSSRAKAQGSSEEGARAASKMSKGHAAADARKDHAEELFHKQTYTPSPTHSANGSENASTNDTVMSSENQPWSNGRIMTLMANDTSRVDQACGMFHLVWTSPFTILLTLAILLSNLTYSALSGFSLMFLGLPILVMVIKSLGKRRKAINRVTDKRMSLTQEILSSIRFVKYYTWEGAFLKELMDIRRQETSMMQDLLTTRNGINAFSYSMPVFAAMLSFITYSLSGHNLTAARVFSSLALFNALRLPFNLLPVVIGQVADAWSSIGRIQSFLMAEEHVAAIVTDCQLPYAVETRAANLVWEVTASRKARAEQPETEQDLGEERASAEGKPFGVHDIDISIGRTELVAIIGKVGSGKSSLLAGIAGDMRITSGHISLGGSRAFCPQNAWIQNATLQDNVLFGKTMDEAWYHRVIHACALQADFDALPAGDQTEIGERGINLSGGQKQRVNLARAIYSDSDIIIMDDPLSAVDAHVGRHIFEEAICGLLKDRCRILATHQLNYLERCDRIVMLEEGRITASGTFNDLVETDDAFKVLLTSVTQSERIVDNDTRPHAAEPPVSGKLPDNENVQLMQEEERAVSSVPWSLYGNYIRASGSMWNCVLPVSLLLLSQGANITTGLWLSYWTSHRFDLSRDQYVGIYVALACLQLLFIFTFSWSLSILGTRSSRRLFDAAMARTLRAPASFFDTTPLGRITNRFSKDADVLDSTLTDALRQYMFTLAMITSVFVLFVVFFHYSGIALGPMLLLFLLAAAYYRSSAREIKRHEANLRSRMFARFSEALTGIPSIRAYGLQHSFTQVLRGTIDDLNSAYYLTFANQRWLNTRLDVVSNLLVLTTGILLVTLRFSINPSISGLVFSYMLSIVQMVQLLVRQMAEVENSMNSTERLIFYGTRLAQEPETDSQKSLPPAWPERGSIVFKNVEMRYRENLPPALKGLNMTIASGERIAIIGRTGAGKSSIANVLFRLTELDSGSITIDDVDISQVAVRELRSRLSIVPQDPALFQGTVRSNLDPFNAYEDLHLWSALRRVRFMAGSEVASTAGCPGHLGIHLDSHVAEDGVNFSLGQRQLLALARALVHNAQVVICDEATSSIDLELDTLIQETIRSSFAGRTLLFIAHRLKTVIKYDRVCVMEAGQVAEMGSPRELWAQEGIFKDMCEQSGIGEKDLS